YIAFEANTSNFGRNALCLRPKPRIVEVTGGFINLNCGAGMPDLVELGNVIRTARKGQRLTQSDLARKSGVSRARIDALENARAAGIGFKPVLRLLNALGLDLKVADLDRARPTLEDLMAEEGDVARLDR